MLSEDELELLRLFDCLDELQKEAFVFFMECSAYGNDTLQNLSSLPVLDYYRVRDNTARQLGMSPDVLDVAVNMWDERHKTAEEDTR